MITELGPADSYSTALFGGVCPYYWTTATGTFVADSADEIIKLVPQEQRRVDPIGCLELLSFGYMLGNRTLVQGVGRLPWRAELHGDGKIVRQQPLPHGSEEAQPASIARRLRSCLEEELSEYISGARRVWVLLSGGLDSRIVAGILSKLAENQQDRPEFHAVTWGRELSRDVSYSRRIADHLGWPLHMIPYDASLLWDNIQEAVSWGGGEISGHHLHGMRALKGLVSQDDVVIAASWGNSIGRGTFLGTHLLDLQLVPVANSMDLISPAIADACIRIAETDRANAWDLESGTLMAQLELDQQENYMRRMIGQAMSYIGQFARLEQAFTSPKTVSNMWTYTPQSRSAEVYYRLLQELDTTLYSIPDANTGISPSGLSEPDPLLTKSIHQFGRWCRVDLVDRLRALVGSSQLADSGVFNMYAVRRLFEWWLEEDTDSWGATERITNLAGIALSIEKFGLLPLRAPSHIPDYLNLRLRRVKDRLGRTSKRIRSWFPWE